MSDKVTRVNNFNETPTTPHIQNITESLQFANHILTYILTK